MRVGLAVVTYKDNFGSALQTYATQRVIREMGIDTKIFDIQSVHRSIQKKKILFYAVRLLKPDEFKYVFYSFLSQIKRKKGNESYARNMKIRHQKYVEFNERYLDFFERADGWGGLVRQSEECDAVLVGSDQLWRPSNISGGYFTLEFVPEHINKIAYATSFGVSVIPKYQHKKCKKFLDRIQYISVRENDGSALVDKLTGRKVPVVCDPTMLLDAQEWLEIQDEEPIISGKYILCYFLGEYISHRNFARELKRVSGYKIVALLHGSTYIAADENFADVTPFDIGPCEFINLIKNAAYICTDSFHGTVFSILNEKEFFSFKRFADESDFSTNDRIRTLLGWTGLTERMINGDENLKDLFCRKIDYRCVREKIEKRRRESREFLENALVTSCLRENKNAYIGSKE